MSWPRVMLPKPVSKPFHASGEEPNVIECDATSGVEVTDGYETIPVTLTEGRKVEDLCTSPAHFGERVIGQEVEVLTIPLD